MSMQTTINTLPDQAKRAVLYSLVGSINASLVGTAASVVSRLQREDYDFLSLTPHDVETLLAEADDRSDLLLHVRRLARVGTTLRDQLIELTNDDEQGSIHSSIEFMTRPNSSRDIDQNLLERTLEAAGIKNIDTGHLKLMHKQQQIQRAERLAAQRGEIEWVIDQVFVAPTMTEVHYEVIDGVDTPIETHHDVDVQLEELNDEMRERLLDKFIAGLERARDAAIIGVLNRDRRYTFADLSLITAAIDEANDVDPAVKMPVTKSKGKKQETVAA